METKDNTQKAPGFWSFKSMRFLLTLTFGLAMLSNVCLRSTLNMAMVCMVSSTKNSSTDSSQYLPPNSTCTPIDDLQNDYQGTFNWGSFEQGFMFGALFFGGFVATLPVGYLADKYSPKNMITIGLIGSSIASFLSPVAAIYGGFIALAVVRVFMGIMTQSTVYTCICVMLQYWIPVNERSTTIALFTAGAQLATIIGTPINALLCHSPFLGGWPAIFYVNGVFGLISVGLWMVLATDRPEDHRFISEAEKAYLTKCLSGSNRTQTKADRKIPYKAMLLSPAMWACIVQDFSCGLLFITLQNYLPTYYKEALFLSLYSNGVVSALPSLCQWVGKILFAVSADFMKRKTSLSHTTICKIFNTISCVGSAAFLIACGYMNCTTATLAVVFISISFVLYSACIPGFLTSMVSIAPAYNGIVSAVCSLAFQLSSLSGPFAVAALTKDGNPSDWANVFLLISIAQLISGILFLMFGSATVQSWAKIESRKDTSTSDATIEYTEDCTNHTEASEIYKF